MENFIKRGVALFALLFALSQLPAQQGFVTTYAGTSSGFSDGPVSTAQFEWPVHTALDATGNLYVSDQRNNRIRKVDLAGNVTTYAGSGAPGLANGPANSAQIQDPWGIEVDGNGNIFVSAVNQIRKIDISGNVTTFAGAAGGGFANGAGNVARFNGSFGIDMDGAGNIYVADRGNHRIRKVDPTGNVSTLAGTGAAGNVDGPANSSQFNNPFDVAVDGSGNVYVAEESNTIRKIDPSGNVSTLAGNTTGGYVDGPGNVARFARPIGIDVGPSGNIYVGDANNHLIRKITPSGTVSTLSGVGIGFADGAPNVARYRGPIGINVAPNGDIFVADQFNQKIRKIQNASAQPVPTLSQWGLIILALTFLSLGGIVIWQRRYKPQTSVS